jgi:hypothetical protein
MSPTTPTSPSILSPSNGERKQERAAQPQDTYKCLRCGAERVLLRPGPIASNRPLLYCAKCNCIRLHELLPGSAGVSPAAVGVPPTESPQKSSQTPANAVTTTDPPAK